MLEFAFQKKNYWEPPEIDQEKIVQLALEKRDKENPERSWLIIFQTKPYIDSLYIDFGECRGTVPEQVVRFSFHSDYVWSAEEEILFREGCVNNPSCVYSYEVIDDIFMAYSTSNPEWHLQRYYTKSLRMLDHIYNCLKQGTAKEMLYKAGLDELASYIDDMDEVNLLSTKPSDIYEGLSMKTLRALNCKDGAQLLSTSFNRHFLMKLQAQFPDVFRESLNDAQCRYLNRLINGDLTVGEVGRLFRARRMALMLIWNHSQYEQFLYKEKKEAEIRIASEKLQKIDPIYADYLGKKPLLAQSGSVTTLTFYLGAKREEFDRDIRRANRKRDLNWQERKNGYVVRFPQTINDFCREAIYMQNCLLTYVEAFINNDTQILFMRRPEEVNKPFITIEVYQGELMQAYHRYNEKCTKEEKQWITEYCIRHQIRCGNWW